MAGAVVAVAVECGIAYPLADRLPAGNAVVIVILDVRRPFIGAF